MDRKIVYPGQIPLETDLLDTNRSVMIALAKLTEAVLGTATYVDGLACTPTTPASLSVNVATGSIYSLQNVDASAYGSLAADTTNSVVKQGVVLGTTTFACAAPATSGFSVVYLIQAAYQDQDGGSTVLPYYNASNPSLAYSGPNNTGVAQNTARKGVCQLSLKAGVAASTGTQATPTPDAGFTALHAVTVANGQTTITSGNISQIATAPFFTKLPAILATIQGGSANFAADTSGAANTVTVTLSPAPAALTTGMAVRVKVANTNTGAVTINSNALGAVAAKNPDGSALHAGQLKAGNVYTFAHDGTNWELQSLPADFQSVFTNGTALTANTTLTSAAHRTVVAANATSGAFTVTLPAASGNAGLLIPAYKSDSSANAVTVNGNGSTVGGFTDILLRSQYETALLYCDGTNWEILSHTAKRRQVAAFTSGGTFNVPADVRTLDKVTATGGGGGGAGVAPSTSGGGGGAGGTAVGYNLAVTPGGTVTVTVGAGGAAGNGSGTNGSDGGNSTFGGLTGNGGGGGFATGTGGVGGSASGGTVNSGGGGGGAGATIGGVSSGLGGASLWGGGGNAVNANNPGVGGNAYGSGGSGGAGSSTSGFGGGAGKAGVVVVEYVSDQ